MLSSQTKDEVTDAAVGKLRTALGGSISVQAVMEAEETLVSEAIAKVGFWRRKTQCVHLTLCPLSLTIPGRLSDDRSQVHQTNCTSVTRRFRRRCAQDG